MRIEGEWILEDNGITRPFVRVKIPDVTGALQHAPFLVDTGADRTVFTAALLSALRIPVFRESTEAFAGVGGFTEFVVFQTVLEFMSAAGIPARVRGQLSGVTDPRALDVNILGRDILNNFDVIGSWSSKEVLLLAPPTQYQIV